MLESLLFQLAFAMAEVFVGGFLFGLGFQLAKKVIK